MGPRCSSAETQVCHRSYIIAANIPPENSLYSSINAFLDSENELVNFIEKDMKCALVGDFNDKKRKLFKPFSSTWVDLQFIGGVRVDHLFKFLCCCFCFCVILFLLVL